MMTCYPVRSRPYFYTSYIDVFDPDHIYVILACERYKWVYATPDEGKSVKGLNP